jgi:hypothetical protein
MRLSDFVTTFSSLNCPGPLPRGTKPAKQQIVNTDGQTNVDLKKENYALNQGQVD